MMEIIDAVNRRVAKLEGATQSLGVGHEWDTKQHSF